MQGTRRIRLSSIQVHWSNSDATFVASSAQYPGLIHTNPFSSLAAVDGLVDDIEHHLDRAPGGRR